MKSYLLSFITFFMFSTINSVFADMVTFNFDDPKKVNSINIIVDSPLEPLSGLVTGISGNITIDPEVKKGIKGEIRAPAKEIQMANKMMTKVLHGDDWLDVKEYPEVSFVFKNIVSVKEKSDTSADIIISGDFSLKGVTREIEIPVRLVYLKGRLNDRNHKGEGDLLAVRSEFTIDRTDFGIQPDMNPSIVAKEIRIIANIIGYAKK